ncbi:MAG TPA: sugar phosphate isomerase/epimerase family protein [Tepidisphaeraceae bacterium]|nr:sugar phosphate isomerase/epimerase family protein [Tepidisphaeraceae bacterium]
MLKLAAFADEISPSLDEQIRVCRDNGVMYFELRGVNNLNVLDFDKPLRNEIRAKLRDNGMGVASIGSPIGKIKITDPWQPHFDRFKAAVEMAEFFGSPLIRIFSYYPPEKGDDIRKYRDEVLRRMQAKVAYVEEMNVTLVHENERDIYGENGPECLDLMKTINSPKLRCAFDFANFVQARLRPEESWPLLKPYTTHIHIKDARWEDGKNVPAGQGDGQIEPILVDAYRSGYRGFLTLEPHLAVAGRFSGFTGSGLFKLAADALKALCEKNHIPLALA